MMPRIAIPQPTSADLEYNRLNFSSYADAVREAAGEPVEVALNLSKAELAHLVASCDGVLLTGSPADVDPSDYGQEREEATAPADPQREATDRLLLEDAFRERKPVLAICFGAQFLNVLQGGTLIQDLAILPVNHAAGRGVMVAHSVSVAPASLLGSLVDPAEVPEVEGYLRLPVNSSHHQAVGIAGAGLRVGARCPQDACIEAVEGNYKSVDGTEAHFLLGVQWHPERTTAVSATSRAIFSRLVSEARSWRASRTEAMAGAR